MNPNFRNFALWVIIFLLVLALVTLFQNPGQRGSGGDIAYSQLLTDAENGRVTSVVISGQEISGTYTDGRTFTTYAPFDPGFVRQLQQKGVQITARPPSDSTPWFISLLVNWLPILVFIGAWIFLSRQMQSGAGRAMGFGKSKAKLLTEAHGRVTFEDVAGVDEAKEDLQEIVEFLRDPAEVPAAWRAAFRAAASSSARPAPARRSSRAPSRAKRTCPSSPSRAPTSSRCSSASAHRASVTCLSRRRRMRPASSSSTRSTRWAATAARASAAATTSASRP
jgi:cell division protease FtsH